MVFTDQRAIGEVEYESNCAVAAMLFVLSMPALGQQVLPGCNHPTRTFTGPNGKTLTLCLDGKYTTCMRDNVRLGFSRATAKRDCDDKKAKGRVK
jgi:hypothetical protein